MGGNQKPARRTGDRRHVAPHSRYRGPGIGRLISQPPAARRLSNSANLRVSTAHPTAVNPLILRRWRKRQESNLPKTPARPPTGLKPARPTGSGTLPRGRIAAFAAAVNRLDAKTAHVPQ